MNIPFTWGITKLIKFLCHKISRDIYITCYIYIYIYIVTLCIVCLSIFVHIHVFIDGEREEEMGTTDVRGKCHYFENLGKFLVGIPW